MIALVHSELLKLRTLRSTAWAAAALLVIALLIAGLALGDAGEKDIQHPAGAARDDPRDRLRGGLLPRRHGRDRGRRRVPPSHDLPALPRQPGPPPGAAGQARGLRVVGAGTAVVVTAVASVLGQAVVSSKGYTLDLGDGGLRMAAGIVLATVLAAMLGVVVGAITRNPTTAMVAIFGAWIAEKIIGDWFGDAAQYLPFALIENVLGLTDADGLGLRGARAGRPDRRAALSRSGSSSRGT